MTFAAAVGPVVAAIVNPGSGVTHKLALSTTVVAESAAISIKTVPTASSTAVPTASTSVTGSHPPALTVEDAATAPAAAESQGCANRQGVGLFDALTERSFVTPRHVTNPIPNTTFRYVFG